jgi:hypothetical protein
MSASALHLAPVLGGFTRLLLFQDIHSIPAELFQFLRPHTVIRQETAFIPAHAQMVHEQRTSNSRVSGGIEGTVKGVEETSYISV